jgi:hypothetical protein
VRNPHSSPARSSAITPSRLGAATVAAAFVAVFVAAWVGISDGATTVTSAAGKAAASTVVSGSVFYDRNDNGVMDPGEPGIAGLRIRDKNGDQSQLTSTTGAYAFPAPPKSGYLQVETGWFRSQCPPASAPTANSCPAGPGTDNAYLVNNQFVQFTLSGKGTTRANVGLVPDWPGRSMTIPAPIGGTVAANPVDVAARLSWVSGRCVGDAYEICRAGDTFSLVGQVFNQGTTALTGVTARVYVPPGDCVTSAAMLPYSVPAEMTSMTVTPADPTCSTRYLDLSLGGALVPAGGVRILISGATSAGPGTPGCGIKKINTKLCPSAEPQGRGWLFGVSHIDQGGDPDSTFCAAGDMTQCPIGLHDKRRAPDEIDPAGHNVDASLAGTTAYDLRAHVAMVGSETVRAWASNQVTGGATNASGEKATVRVWFPSGTAVVAVPAKHNLISCDAGKPADGSVVVTCALGGPIAPSISSPGADITVARMPDRVVVCVAPPAGAMPETVPATAGCDLDTDATATPTDNDADLTSP